MMVVTFNQLAQYAAFIAVIDVAAAFILLLRIVNRFDAERLGADFCDAGCEHG